MRHLLVLTAVLLTALLAALPTTAGAVPAHFTRLDTTTAAGSTGAVRSGLWSDPATWAGGVPGAGTAVAIPAGTTVTLDTATAPIGRLRIDGVLDVADVPTSLTAADIQVHGTFRAGAEDALHAAPLTVTLTGRDDDPLVGRRALAVHPGAILDLHGGDAQRTSWSQLAADALPGASSLVMAEPVDWPVGARIVVAPSGLEATEAEFVTVTGVDGATVQLDRPLAHHHLGRTEVIEGRLLDQRAEVGLLSRSIVITSAADADADGLGGHVIVLEGGVARVEGVELRGLGQAGGAGRYSFHWHLAGDVSGQYLRSSSIHQAHHRGVVAHLTDAALVEDVVAADISGHAFIFSEDGPEVGNVFRDNLCVLVRAIPRGVPGAFAFPVTERDGTVSVQTSSQNENVGAGFWGRNPQNVLEGNHVAGADGRGMGFWYDRRGMSHPAKQAMRERLSPMVFADNAAHSIEGNPNNQYSYGPEARGHALFVSTYEREFDFGPFALTGFTAYKADTGAWLEDGLTTLSQAIISDTSAGALMHRSWMVDSVIAGARTPVGGVPDPLSDQDMGGGVHYTNQGGDKIIRLRDVTFVGVRDAAIVVRQTPLADGSTVSGLRFVDTSPIVFTGEHRDPRRTTTGVIADTDGTLSGRGLPSTVGPDASGRDCALVEPWRATVCTAG